MNMNQKEYNLQESLGYLVNTASRALNTSLARAFTKAGHDLTVEQFEILVILWKRDGQCQHELATASGKDRPSVTRILDNMEKRALVTRISSEKDRRNKIIRLTKKGKDCQKALLDITKANAKISLKGLDEKSVASGKAFLGKLIENLK
jgi:DNA-binding MarR family transcriptional regulator